MIEKSEGGPTDEYGMIEVRTRRKRIYFFGGFTWTTWKCFFSRLRGEIGSRDYGGRSARFH